MSRLSRRDKEILLAHLLKIDHKLLGLKEDMEVSPDIVESFLELSSKVGKGYPLQYAIGEWDFYGRTFKTKEGVLIPRPETEILVEEVLKRLDYEERVGYEIGVGSGCISITLLLERPKLVMHACDIQEKAIELSKENALLHGVGDRLILHKGSLFEPVKGMKFDFIVSNPPYIPEYQWEKLPEGVRLEGYQSLIGGTKGYEYYEKIALEVEDYLKDGGFFAFEIGHDQGKVVTDIFRAVGFNVELHKDLSGQDRVVVGWK